LLDSQFDISQPIPPDVLEDGHECKATVKEQNWVANKKTLVGHSEHGNKET